MFKNRKEVNGRLVTRTKQPAESYNKEKIKAKRSKKRNT